jgi:hypothetical protein
MSRCEVCGNEYDKAMEIRLDGTKHTFDSFECAIHALAPACAQSPNGPPGSYPLTTPSGASRATRTASPARSTTATTCSTSLYANGASSASPRFEGQRTTMP